MNSIRSILSRAAVAAIVSIAGFSQVARAHPYYWREDAIEQADGSVCAARQALDAARSQQCAADAAYHAAISRVETDQKRAEQIECAIRSLNENLQRANREADLRRYAIGTIQQRL